MTVVVYHIGSLGDTVVTVPALRLVRTHFPSAHLVLLYNDSGHRAGVVSARTVLEGSGLIDTFVSYDADGTWRERLSSATRAVRRCRPDVAVYLAPSDRAGWAVWRDRVFFRLCGARRLVGFRLVPEAASPPRDSSGRMLPVTHEAHRKIRRLQEDGVGIGGQLAALAMPLLTWTTEEEAAATSWLDANRRDDRPIVAVAPTTNMLAKVWPVERFVQIGRRLAAAGCELAFFGGPGDRALGDRLTSAWGRGLNTAGALDVRTSGALLSHCAWHLGLDSGSTHLAAAAGLRCVSISSDVLPPGQWDPLGAGHVVVRHPVACGGCLQQTCPVADHPCMSEIGVDEVWQAIRAAGLVKV